jgi:hypothetical protein
VSVKRRVGTTPHSFVSNPRFSTNGTIVTPSKLHELHFTNCPVVKTIESCLTKEAVASPEEWHDTRAESDEREEGGKSNAGTGFEQTQRKDAGTESVLSCAALLRLEMFSTFSFMHGRFDILK